MCAQDDAWLNVRFDHDEAGALVIPHTRAVAAPRRGLIAYTTCDKSTWHALLAVLLVRVAHAAATVSVEMRLANQVGAITLADGDEPVPQTASDAGSETGSAGRARGRAPMSRKRRQTLDSSLSSTRSVGKMASDSAGSTAGGAGRPLPSTAVRAQIGAELQAKARAAGVSALPAGAVNGIVTPQPLPRNAGVPAAKRVAAAAAAGTGTATAVASSVPAPPPSLASTVSLSDTASASARLSARDKYRNRKAQSRGVPVAVPALEPAMSPAHEMVAGGRGVDGDEDVDVGDVNDLVPRAQGAGVARTASKQVARAAVARGAPISEVPLTVEQVFAWVSRAGAQTAAPAPVPLPAAQAPSEPAAVLAAQSGWRRGLISHELARYTTLSGSVVSCVLSATAHIRQSLAGTAGNRSGAPAYTQLAVAPFVTRW